jgi:hypothetical protein
MPGEELTIEELLKVPIELPENPFWEVFKRFGRDEAIAAVINVAGTAGIDLATDSAWFNSLAGVGSRRAKDIAVSLGGPIVEKAGFFPGHFRDAYKEWKSTPEDERDELSTYFKQAVRGGGKSLLEDILVHDPVYIGLMMGGLHLWPETPAAILSLASFAVAVGIVSVGEVGVTELLYRRYKKALRKKGFGTEKYYESRFLIGKDTPQDELLADLIQRYGLGEPKTGRYHDRYFKDKLPVYNGRHARVRLRQRDREDGSQSQSAQIIYKKASEMAMKHPEQFRFFPQWKEKLYFGLEGDMPWNIDDIEDPRVRRVLKRTLASDEHRDIEFERTVAHDPESLFVSTDRVHNGDRPFYVAEIKVYKNTELLKDAMRYIMRTYPVVQTTHGKFSLSALGQ